MRDLSYPQVESLLSAFEVARAQYDDEAYGAVELLMALAESRGWVALEKRAVLIMADFATRRSDLGRASVLAKEVTTWAVQHGDTYLEARGAFVLSMIAFAIGDTATTLIEGLHSVRLLDEDVPLGVRIDHMLMAAVGHGAGTVEGEQCYADVLELTLAAKDVSAALTIHNNRAWHHYVQGDRPEAMREVAEMLKLAEQLDTPLKVIMLDTVARVQIMHDQFDEALHTLEPVIAGDEDLVLGEPTARVGCLLALASIHRRRGDFALAATMLDQAEAEASFDHLLASQAEVHQERSIWHAAQGDFAAAFAQYVLFHELANRVTSEEAERHAHLVHAVYEVEQAGRDATRFRELAYRDPLTGMRNRRFLDEELPRLCATARRDRTPLTAAIIDVDHFKRINDDLSHETGDQVLRILAELFERAAGPGGVVGRLGGEEFALLLAESPAEQALQRCEEIRLAVQGHDWAPVTGDVPVTVSIGVSTAPEGVTSPGALLSDADRNLYAAKRSGRNRVMGDPDGRIVTVSSLR